MTSPSGPFTFHLGSSAAPSPSKSLSAKSTPFNPLVQPIRSPSSSVPATTLPAVKIESSPPVTSARQEEALEDPLVASLRDTHATALRSLTTIFDQAIEYRGDHARVDSLQQEIEVWKTQYFEKAKAIAAFEAEALQLREKERAATEAMRKVQEEQDNLSLFSAVLLDGDGLIFAHNLMTQGALGGREAARILLSSLPSIIARKLPHKAKIQSKILGKVLVNVFINKTGLSNTLVKAGIVSSHAVFNDFYNGLSQAHDLISVVDVGLGKEASDAKMREYLRLYAANAQCGMILLGASHDNGYAPILSSLATEGRLANVLLLKGYNSVAFELQQYKHLTVEILGLFRSEKVVIIPGSFENKPVISSTPKKAGPIAILKGKNKTKDTPKKEAVPAFISDNSDDYETEEDDLDIPHVDTADLLKVGDKKTTIIEDDGSDDLSANIAKLSVSGKKGQSGSHAKSKAKSNGSGSTPNRTRPGKDYTFQMKLTEDNGWVGVKTPKAASSTPPGKVFAPIIGGTNEIVTPSKGNVGYGKQDKSIKVEGADTVVRTLNPRPCHKEYLTEEGCDNFSCLFGHNYDLTKGQLALLRKLVSEMPCPYFKFNRCSSPDGEDCIYGHVCPQAHNCRWGANCRFNELPGGGH